MNAEDFNPFKSLNVHDELPEEDRKKVLDTIDTMKFIIGVADLFTTKQVEVNTDIFSAFVSSSFKETNG